MIEHAKKQCFGYSDGDCRVLMGVTTCKGCRFYKTQKQFDEDAARIKTPVMGKERKRNR